MKGLIVYKSESSLAGGYTSQLREFRNIPDNEATRLYNELTDAGFPVFEFQEGKNV